MAHDLLNQSAGYDPGTLKLLGQAFDEAWKVVQDSGVSFASNGHSEATREFFARSLLSQAGI